MKWWCNDCQGYHEDGTMCPRLKTGTTTKEPHAPDCASTLNGRHACSCGAKAEQLAENETLLADGVDIPTLRECLIEKELALAAAQKELAEARTELVYRQSMIDSEMEARFHERESVAALGRKCAGLETELAEANTRIDRFTRCTEALLKALAVGREKLELTETELKTAMHEHARVAWDGMELQSKLDRAVRCITELDTCVDRHTLNCEGCKYHVPCLTCNLADEAKAIVEGAS